MNKKGLRNIARIKPFTLFLLGLVVSCGAFFAQPTVTHAEEDITAIAKKMGTTLKADGIPKAAIVVDADSGEILWSQPTRFSVESCQYCQSDDHVLGL
ncbi:hypothetical protein EfsSVR2331_28570 [Enterococcus faecalis]|nr:hypothetical protein EfsSVR2331_28570 [Enterococcus faecalis]